MNEQIYTNYFLQLPDQQVLGTLVIRDGVIADIQPGVVSHGYNGHGDYLLPGLVELHTDHLEQCMSPRPCVQWPLEAAVVHHDRALISAGITTVCDAIAIGDVTPISMRLTRCAPILSAIDQARQLGRLTADHRFHLRCELAHDQVCHITAQFADHPLLSLISLMDHAPGQRQYTQIEKYREYYMAKQGVSEREIAACIQVHLEAQHHNATQNRKRIVKLAQQRGVALASHDDATVNHVQEAVRDGAAIAEFPTTLDAAREARYHGLYVLMGAPNLVLGGSHSGNVSAMDLVEKDLVDIISSDYVPHSLLLAMFLVVRHTKKPLYEVMRLFTINPARAIRLEGDRGSLEVHKRADLITIHDDGVVPRLTSVICSGQRVA